MITSAYKVGGWGEKRKKHAYVIFEWSLMKCFLHSYQKLEVSIPNPPTVNQPLSSFAVQVAIHSARL